MQNLPIAHVLYAHDALDGSVLILECNNSIYMGEDMVDSLINPIQCEDNNVRVNIRPKAYYPADAHCQSLVFDDGTTTMIVFDGVLPYIPVKRPTKDEIHYCRRLSLTSRDL